MSIWMARCRFVTDPMWLVVTGRRECPWGRGSAVEKAELWKPWKTKGRFPPAPTAPWKSRTRREIPTFPPRRLYRFHAPRRSRDRDRILIWAVQKWKSESRIPTFAPPRQPQAQGRQSEQITNY